MKKKRKSEEKAKGKKRKGLLKKGTKRKGRKNGIGFRSFISLQKETSQNGMRFFE
jgi:hypothetical protein